MTNPYSPQSNTPQQNPYETSYPQEAFPETAFVQSAPQQKQQRGLGAATVACSVVLSLLAGAGAGYAVVAANDNGEQQHYNALENPSLASPETAPDGSVEQVAAAVLPSVVSITVATPNGIAEGSGSIISSDGYILTNHHVIGAAATERSEIQVVFNDGSKHSATFVASDVNTDIGVLKVDGVENLPVLDFGNSDELKVGQQVVAVGSPLGLSATVTSGIISAKNRPVRAAQGGGESSLMDGLQTDAAINPGNSGGPLVDMQGHLIGMNSAIASLSAGGFGGEQSSGSIGLGFAIPSNFAKRVAQQLIETGKASQPMLGVRVSIRGTRIDGAVVAGVEPGSPAEKAGIREGDVITKLDGRLIDSADALIAATRSKDFGQVVQLEVLGEGEEAPHSVDVTLSNG